MSQHGVSESVWDYPRPPRVERDTRQVTIRHAGMLVADTRAALRVLETSHPPVFYLLPADVAATMRQAAGRSFCEFKGVATYWDLIAGDAVVPGAAWSYERPAPGYEALAGRFAFYPSKLDECAVDGERVTAQPGDFYGGWITSEIAGPFKGGPGTLGW